MYIFVTNLYDLNTFKIWEHRNYTLLGGSTKIMRYKYNNLLGLPLFPKLKALKI
jgi:hypothetical protein